MTGESTPTVLFESGMGASCLSWTLVQPAVAEFSRAVSYDRAGHGWSDPAHEPRTARQIAQELRALLDVAGLPGPYVLVAHSFGGYISRAFAHLYRDEVVGTVLVDSIHPAEWENPTPEQMTMVQVGLRYAGIAAWGLARAIRCSAVVPRSGGEGVSSLGPGGECVWSSRVLECRTHRGGDPQAARTDCANCSGVLVGAEEFYKPGTARCGFVSQGSASG